MPPLPQMQLPAAASTDAKLEALEKQNAMLREDAIRRQANEGMDRLMNTIAQNKADSDAKFNAMLERMERAANATPRTSESEATLRMELQKLQQQHEREMAQVRMTQQEAELRREIANIQANAKSESDKIQQQLAAADKQLSQSAQTAMFDRMAKIQEDARAAERRAFEDALKREPGMLEMMKLFKTLQGDDPFASKLKEFALDQLFNGPQGGQPSSGQMIAQLAGTAVEKVTGAIGSYMEHKTVEERRKMAAETEAKRKAEMLRRQQMGGGQQQQAQAPQGNGNGLNGAARNGNGANGAQHAVPAPQAPLPIDPNTGEIPVEDLTAQVSNPAAPDNLNKTAEEILADEEKPYFGDAYSQVCAMRKAVSAGLMKPEAVVNAVVDAFMYFQGFSVDLPVTRDIMHDPRRAIDRALPDAKGTFRAKVLELLPGALKEAMDDLKNDVEEQEGQ
jgi:hypothetical protein